MLATSATAQEGGNRLYQPNNNDNPYKRGYMQSPYQQYGYDMNQYAGGTLQPYQYLSDTSFMLTAHVLKNVHADQFVAMFSVNQVDTSVEAVNEAMDTRLQHFIGEVQRLGIPRNDLFIDFITQVPIYDYRSTGRITTEQRPGFELKKTISIRFRNHHLMDTLVRLAAFSEIYDLVKVDYVIDNLEQVYNELVDTAMHLNEVRKARYEKFNGDLKTHGVIMREEYATRYPENGYMQYTAYESTGPVRYVPGQVIVPERKTTTFYFNSVDLRGYDQIVGSAIIDPVVQVTLNLTAKYTAEKPKTKATKA